MTCQENLKFKCWVFYAEYHSGNTIGPMQFKFHSKPSWNKAKPSGWCTYILSIPVEEKKRKKVERMQLLQQARQAKNDQCMYNCSRNRFLVLEKISCSNWCKKIHFSFSSFLSFFSYFTLVYNWVFYIVYTCFKKVYYLTSKSDICDNVTRCTFNYTESWTM